MLRRLGILLTVLAFGLVPANALATPQDVASTHTYLVANYEALHASVSTWSTFEANARKLKRKLAAECPNAGAGSPQNEDEQKLSYEVVGALWAIGYRTNAKVIQKFVRAVRSLRWSNPSITRQAHDYAMGLSELSALQVPDVCGDIRTWTASGYKTIPASTLSYDKHAEAIEAKEITPRLLTPFLQGSDKALATRDIRLNTQFEHLEEEKGFDDWDMLLETVGLNQ